jgi:hypothetical protein
MKRMFYIGLILLALFEFFKVYFIMPMPGSQQGDTLELAYFLHSYRWPFRIFFILISLSGLPYIFHSRKIFWPLVIAIISFSVVYLFNFQMTAEQMFKEPENLVFKNKNENSVNPEQVALLVEINDEAKAYPIEYIAYHHQVRDKVGGKSIMVTYCSVCRSGRVFEPVVFGKEENFRLVGMDYFNAMFEDSRTKSWWRQASGEAVVGTLKGNVLPEIPSQQLSISQIFDLYPHALIMQPDDAFTPRYDTLFLFEQGLKQSKLTGTDSVSWNDKSWVVGIQINNISKAYDWNRLKTERIIHDVIGEIPLLLILSEDNKSFVAFQRPNASMIFKLDNGLLKSDEQTFNMRGENLSDKDNPLKPIIAYQEFWHSWRTFHPETLIY